jgi:hypothetical protein
MGSGERGGNAELVRTARKYFAHALELKPSGNLRALYGVLLCCAAAPKGAKEREANASLFAAAQKLLDEEYAAAGASKPMRAMVETALATLRKEQ